MPELLVLDTGARAARRTAALAHDGNVVSASTLADADRVLQRRPIDIIVTVYELGDGTALDVCRLASEAPSLPSVLVAGPDIPHVADLITAGCDGVLLKSADMNVLCSRVRRLLRTRLLSDHSRGTTLHHADEVCASCQEAAVHSFDRISRDKAWYACTACRRVWRADWREPDQARLLQARARRTIS
jgi:DNA-binding response OmpR family regulator